MVDSGVVGRVGHVKQDRIFRHIHVEQSEVKYGIHIYIFNNGQEAE